MFEGKGSSRKKTELLKLYIYSRNKETNNIKLGTKQTKINKLN